jgi:hypothetical protein
MTKWVKAKFDDEIKSFTAIANKISYNINEKDIKKKIVEQMLDDFKKKYNSKNLQELKLSAWRKLQGSESWNTDTMIKIEKHLKGADDIKKLYQSIYEITSGKSVGAPIIMMQNNVGMLISGEHTLMACKLLNIQPKVIMI